MQSSLKFIFLHHQLILMKKSQSKRCGLAEFFSQNKPNCRLTPPEALGSVVDKKMLDGRNLSDSCMFCEVQGASFVKISHN